MTNTYCLSGPCKLSPTVKCIDLLLLLQMREEAEAGLQSLVEAAQEEVADTKASLRDCQDMLEEMQTFSEDRQHEAAEAAARAEVGAAQHATQGRPKLSQKCLDKGYLGVYSQSLLLQVQPVADTTGLGEVLRGRNGLAGDGYAHGRVVDL
jgi:hypothetical protein